MNAEDKMRFEELKDDYMPKYNSAWLISKVEESQAELAKVKGQRDRLAELLRRAHIERRNSTFSREVEKALAELEKENELRRAKL